MESRLSEEALWASGLASRLRLIQANFADDPSSVRKGYIVEEIERALKPISPTRRKNYLESLAERFPAWEGVRSTASSDAKVGAAPLPAEELVARLVGLAPALSPEARKAFASQLQAVDLCPKPQSHESLLELPPDLQKKLGLPSGKPLQLERAVKLLVITMELTLALDQLAWALWRQLAPKSVIRKEVEFNRLAGTYLAGDAEVSTAQLAQPIEKTRRLITGLLNAVGLAGSAYAKEYVKRLSPEQIEDWAKMEKSPFQTLESACWKKFVQQAREHASERAVEHDIQEAIVKAAGDIIQGRRAAG
jgi:hypothetical protein